MPNEIAKSNILDSISDKLSGYLAIKDALLENDYFEVLGDSVNVLRFLKNANQLIAKKRFDSFLKGFSNENSPSEFQLSKLYDYIDNELKAEFIADIFSKVMLSTSKLSCVIMGIIAKNLIENRKDISHDDLVCAEALTKFFDYDIRNYKKICEYLENYMKNRKIKKRKGFEINYAFTKYCIEDGTTTAESVNLTLEKAISYQLFYKENEIDLDVDEDDVGSSSISATEQCIISNPGEQLYKYIQKIEYLL